LHITNNATVKELNIIPVFEKKMQNYGRNCLRCVNRMLRNGFPGKIKKVHNKRQKKPGKTAEETSGCVRPEQVTKWHVSYTMMMITNNAVLSAQISLNNEWIGK
jgi:hypothetical protein